MKNEELFIGCVFLIIICVLWEIYNTSRLTTYLKQQQKELENLKSLGNITFYGELVFYKEQISSIASDNIKLVCYLLINRSDSNLKEKMKIIEKDLFYLEYSENKECDKEIIDLLLDASNKWKNDHVFQECKNEVGETLEKYLNSVKTNSCDQQIKDLKKIYS